MNRKAQTTIVRTYLLLAVVLTGTAMAQSTNDAFKQAVAQYQQSPTPANAEAIIKLALGMKPAPAVPEEAEKFIARGQAAVESAKEPADFKAAAAEFEKAVLAAPWIANAYYNLGVVQDKAGDYAGAIRNLNLYLLAAPNADDARAVKSLIYKIEFKQEKTARESAASQIRQSTQPTLEGTWTQGGSRDLIIGRDSSGRYIVECSLFGLKTPPLNVSGSVSNIKFTQQFPAPYNQRIDMEFTISADGSSLQGRAMVFNFDDKSTATVYPTLHRK
jgi:tetratricopeptide (TPR) repeat protein